MLGGSYANYRVIRCMLYNGRFTGRHGESHLSTGCSPTIYCLGYNIDNVNITDRVA